MQPLHDNMIIEPVELVQQIGSIIIPDHGRAQKRPQLSIVKHVGKGFYAIKRPEKFISHEQLGDFEPGEVILHGQYSATGTELEYKVDDIEQKVIRARDVIAILVNPDKLNQIKENKKINLNILSTEDFVMMGQQMFLQADEDKIQSDILIIPDTAQKRSNIATVISIGPGHYDWDYGFHIPTTLVKGNKVIISNWAGAKIKFIDKHVWWMEEKDILGKIEK